MKRNCQRPGCSNTFEANEKSTKRFCPACFKLSLSEGAKKGKAAQTPEQRSEQARKAGACADKAKAVRNQWKSIKKSEKYGEFCERRADRMKTVWTKYDDNKKEHILRRLIEAKETHRSKFSDEVKTAMTAAGLTGFKSEEYFEGYFPDEINYDKKLIVEINGDYFHCNPKEFTDPEQYLPFLQCKVKDRWEHDKERTAKLESLGYKILIIWESDWKADSHRELERIKRWYQSAVE